MSTAKSIISFFFEHNLPKPRTDATKMRSVPASVRKLTEKSEESDGSSSDEDCNASEGFPLVDLSVLSSAFQLFRCPACKYGRVELEEVPKWASLSCCC